MKLSIYVLCLCVTFTLFAKTGNAGGAGGDAVILNGKPYLLDLVEKGIEEDAYIDVSLKNAPSFDGVRRRVGTALAALKNDPVVDGVTEKLLEIGQYATPFAYLLLEAMEQYQWSLVAPALVPIDDEDSPLDIGTTVPKVQLAIRKIYQVYVNRDLWKQLSLSHQVALVFHETAYALVKPEFATRPGPTGPEGYYRQSSVKARQLVGYLFVEDHYVPGAHLPFTQLASLGTILLGADIPWAFNLNRHIYDIRGEGPSIHYSADYWMGGTGGSWGASLPATRYGRDWKQFCTGEDAHWELLKPGERVKLIVNALGLAMTRDSFLGRSGRSSYYLSTRLDELHRTVDGWENVVDAKSCLDTYGATLENTTLFWLDQKSIFALPE